jgi:hypothetical protein
MRLWSTRVEWPTRSTAIHIAHVVACILISSAGPAGVPRYRVPGGFLQDLSENAARFQWTGVVDLREELCEPVTEPGDRCPFVDSGQLAVRFACWFMKPLANRQGQHLAAYLAWRSEIHRPGRRS